MDLLDITAGVKEITHTLLEAARLKAGQILVVGCSTSEIQGQRIGSAGSVEVAQAVLDGIESELAGSGIYLAAQCCEHLNRALVISAEACEKYSLTEVRVLPICGAGGAVASELMTRLPDGVVVETVAAHAGMDIGDTLIGMHLRPVAVPVRPSSASIGGAHVTLARTRPKLIGGARAVYAFDEVEQRFGKRVSKTKQE